MRAKQYKLEQHLVPITTEYHYTMDHRGSGPLNLSDKLTDAEKRLWVGGNRIGAVIDSFRVGSLIAFVRWSDAFFARAISFFEGGGVNYWTPPCTIFFKKIIGIIPCPSSGPKNHTRIRGLICEIIPLHPPPSRWFGEFIIHSRI
ncbi:hypothetical protein AVEN_269498-1 [Araneus ventricosus]|uniref:Uncharacterized protein n=1 Tax=Araneus ventricosus TaxID=182803 RepID=A0A4Y2S423_ARAVE|nr:hypothetical protein AVEN_259646-1 [Araneus ventricosus]GBN82180.1 hypothetical protein AVEN_269498-1 [Araneus ventricosus]